MKVLVYEASAGFSSYTYRLCNALSRLSDDIEITYLTTKENSEIHELDKRIILLSNLKNYDSSKKNSMLWLLNRLYVSIFNVICRNIECRKHKYDVASIQFTIPIIDQFFINRLCKRTKVVYTAHDVIPPNKSKFWNMDSLEKMYSIIPHIIVHTDGNKTQLMDIFNVNESKISIIHHGMESDYNHVAKHDCLKKLGIKEQKFTLLFYGSIREQKGLDNLIKALRGIDDIQLIIAGSMPYGESFDSYKYLIDQNHVNTLEMIKYIPFEMTDYLFQACDVVCLPYKYFYSQSGVFMQAIQYRKPVIVSEVSSFGEYLDKYKMGLLCKPNDVNDLHDAILRMKTLLSGTENPFIEGLEKAAKDNSWEESAVKHFELFKEL